MKLKLRNVFFSPDERGNGKIQDVKKGHEIEVDKEELDRMIKDGVEVLVIPAEEGIKEKENEK